MGLRQEGWRINLERCTLIKVHCRLLIFCPQACPKTTRRPSPQRSLPWSISTLQQWLRDYIDSLLFLLHSTLGIRCWKLKWVQDKSMWTSIQARTFCHFFEEIDPRNHSAKKGNAKSKSLDRLCPSVSRQENQLIVWQLSWNRCSKIRSFGKI
jgi:hypothetical protein